MTETRKSKSALTEFRISTGNSSTGPVGFAMDIIAESREKALKVARELIPEQVSVPFPSGDFAFGGDRFSAGPIVVYFNPEKIPAEDVHPLNTLVGGPPSFKAACLIQEKTGEKNTRFFDSKEVLASELEEWFREVLDLSDLPDKDKDIIEGNFMSALASCDWDSAERMYNENCLFDSIKIGVSN